MNDIKLLFSGRYVFILVSLVASIIYTFPLIAFLTTKSEIPGDKDYTGICIFYVVVISVLTDLFLTGFNMVREVIIDESCVRILKSKDYKVIPFSQIKHITFSTGKLGGLRFIWIRRKDDIDKIETSFLSISTFSISNINKKLEILMNELEKKTIVKKTRII